MQRPQAPVSSPGAAPSRLTPSRAALAIGARRPQPPNRFSAPPRDRLPLLLLSDRQVIPAMFADPARAVEVRRVRALPPAESLDPTRSTVVLLDRALLSAEARVRVAALSRVAALVAVGDHGDREPAPECPEDLLTAFVTSDAPERATLIHLRGAFRAAAALAAAHVARERERERQRELAELSRVGAALTIERDLVALLEMILTQARRVTASDAGSLYLVERDASSGAATALRFVLAQNDSVPDLALAPFLVPVDDTSVAGYAARTGQLVSLDDVAAIGDDAPYRVNRAFDAHFDYHTKSMLVVPLVSNRDEVVGVLQLINRKRAPGVPLLSPEVTEREVLPFDERTTTLVRALAAQAAVAIENSQLYESIERLFEGFVTASVTAIEQRDPATSGHSVRVADLTVRLAHATERAGTGPYRGLTFTRDQFRELRYAALLHDFGKVGVREEVLVKAKKLHPASREAIRHRFAFLVQTAELEFERARAQHLLAHGRAGFQEAERELERALRARRLELEQYHQAIVAACEPTLTDEGTLVQLSELGHRTFLDLDGEERPLLAPAELRQLSVRQGTLDARERAEVEAHASYTFRFLQQIPWTRELRGVPDIAHGHHEKLDGSGYPRALTADAIPVQVRMLTIADIYDALTATDRPYKRAVMPADAVDILRAESAAGQLDADLLDVFIGARVWEPT